MTLIEIDSTYSKIDSIRKLYHDSFPPEERRDWHLLMQAVADGRVSLYAVLADGALAGMITLWRLGPVVYVEHFAMMPSLRGGGLGAKVLGRIVAMADVPVVLEVERPDAGAMACRRIEFYRRNGFSTIDGFDYVQPPYAPGLPSVPLLLMSTEPVDAAEVAALLHRHVYGVGNDTL